MCERTKDNEDLSIILTTHGDISEDKINAFNPSNKKEHCVAVSYHHYQVEFDEWWRKVQSLNERVNVLVSSIIPRRPKVWNEWQKNMDIILDSGIPIEMKPELKKEDNTVDYKSVDHWREYIIKGEKTIRDKLYLSKTLSNYITIKDSKRSITIPREALYKEIPIVPNKTLCGTKVHMLVDDRIFISCGQGKDMHLSINTSIEEFQDYINGKPILCKNSDCQGDRYNPPNIKILNLDLDTWEY